MHEISQLQAEKLFHLGKQIVLSNGNPQFDLTLQKCSTIQLFYKVVETFKHEYKKVSFYTN